MDADGTGVVSIYNFPELAVQTRVKQVRSFSECSDIFQGYRANDPRVAGTETFVIDTMSHLAKLQLDEFIDSELHDHPNREPVPYQRDYKYNTESMRRLIQWFMQLDTNLIVLCHSEQTKDEATGMVIIRPFLTPRLLSSMEAVFDVFGYMTSTPDAQFNEKRTLQIKPSRNIWAKSRLGGLPPIIPDPNFGQLLWAKEQMMNNVKKFAEENPDKVLVQPTVQRPIPPPPNAPQGGIRAPVQQPAQQTMGQNPQHPNPNVLSVVQPPKGGSK